MEEVQQSKHVCRFCSKNFPCGRSLGGHIRSHLNNSSEPITKHSKKKLPFKTMGDKAFALNGYGLKETPMKANKLAKSTEVGNMLCKKCGKGFQSWKALFGHMKCHSEKVLEEVSWNSQLNQKKISKTIERYVSDYTGKDQEEVAMSLILLSKDNGVWGGLNSIGKSSCYNSKFCGAESSSQTDQISKDHNKLILEKLKDTISGSKKTKFQLKASGIQRNEIKIKKPELQTSLSFEHGKLKKIEKGIKHRVSEVKLSKESIDKSVFVTKKKFSRKRKTTEFDSSEDSTETELSPNQITDSKVIKCHSYDNFVKTDHGLSKKNKGHKCLICFRIFASGQALGGHKRSHLISATRSSQSVVIRKSIPEVRDFLDLNLPPPHEDESFDQGSDDEFGKQQKMFQVQNLYL